MAERSVTSDSMRALFCESEPTPSMMVGVPTYILPQVVDLLRNAVSLETETAENLLRVLINVVCGGGG
jgi:hypothetical protein